MQTTQDCTRTLTRSGANPLDRFLEALREWSSQQVFRARIRRERRQLRDLSDATLRDIGIDRGDALAEARRDDIPPSRQPRQGC